jgi:hypothetical protein
MGGPSGRYNPVISDGNRLYLTAIQRSRLAR